MISEPGGIEKKIKNRKREISYENLTREQKIKYHIQKEEYSIADKLLADDFPSVVDRYVKIVKLLQQGRTTLYHDSGFSKYIMANAESQGNDEVEEKLLKISLFINPHNRDSRDILFRIYKEKMEDYFDRWQAVKQSNLNNNIDTNWNVIKAFKQGWNEADKEAEYSVPFEQYKRRAEEIRHRNITLNEILSM
ncbi:MAG: hypothetical protein ABH828_00835 [archaeon]